MSEKKLKCAVCGKKATRFIAHGGIPVCGESHVVKPEPKKP